MNTGSGDNGLMSDINVTPFVDVMLVLLIIFMVTAPMLYRGMDIKLPVSASNARPVEFPEAGFGVGDALRSNALEHACNAEVHRTKDDVFA